MGLELSVNDYNKTGLSPSLDSVQTAQARSINSTIIGP